MVRLAWGCIVIGLIVSAGSVFKFFLSYLADPAANDPFMGFWTVIGFMVGIVIATLGGVIVAKAHGRWVPPI
jgi:hypothetical protein